MIVKIRTKDGWKFLSNVKKVEFQTNDRKTGEVKEIGNINIIEIVEKNVKVKNLYVKYNDLSEENHIITDEVYLMTDVGKTIERLN